VTTLRTIGYVSSATRLLHASELEQLVAQARRANAAQGITGVLLHCDGNFMQVIEGPAPDVSATYARIASSAAHRDIFQLFDEPIEAREFESWSMACRRVSERDFEALRLAEQCTHRQMLADFWRLNA
jgi:hypothetical protein